MTKRDLFTTLIEVVNVSDCDDDTKQELVEGLNHEIGLLNRKSTSSRITKTQEENGNIKNWIYEVLLNCDHAVTVSELQTLEAGMEKYSNQKLSALLRQMVSDGRVVKTTEGRKSCFAVAD